MKAQVCPVCFGKCTVSDTFYTGLSSSTGGRIECKSCGGKGIVFAPEEVSAVSPSICPKCRNTGQVSKGIPNGIAIVSSSCDACGRRQVAMNHARPLKTTTQVMWGPYGREIHRHTEEL